MKPQEWLDIVVIPIFLVLIALFWPMIQSWHRCRVLTRLVFRELQEVGPFPSESERDHWAEHLRGSLSHCTIIREVSQNIDYVLSLDPNLVFHLSQLWDAIERKDKVQWSDSLWKLAGMDRTGNLERTMRDKWELAPLPLPPTAGK